MEKNQQDYVQLNVDGTLYSCLTTKKYNKRKVWNALNKDEVRSIIPGTVVNLYVKEGDQVEVGDLLMLYEAMKMENRIYASISGKITNVQVKEGDKLPKNALMLSIQR